VGKLLDLFKGDSPVARTLRGALIAGAGALFAVVAQAATSGALGPIWGPVVGALASVAINWLRVQGQ
jgi:hypothetical protein